MTAGILMLPMMPEKKRSSTVVGGREESGERRRRRRGKRVFWLAREARWASNWVRAASCSRDTPPRPDNGVGL